MMGLTTLSQSLTKKITWKTSSISNSKIEWVDLDNDSLLDVLVLARGANQKLQVITYKNGLASFAHAGNQEIDVILNSYSLIDLNSDNKLDLVINGFKNNQQSIQLINQSNFQFASSNISAAPLQITQQAWADFNQDGKLDWIVGGTDFLKIFQSTAIGYVNKLDSSGLKITSILTMDVSKDGKTDLIISGNKQGREFMMMIQNKGGFNFEYIPIAFGIDGNLEVGDFNYDGFFDVVVSGNNQIKYFSNNSSRLMATDSVFGFQKGELKIANFDSGSLVDLSYTGRLNTGERTTFIRSSGGNFTQLDSALVTTQKWGDYDRDGDLDLLQVKDSAGYQVFQILENKTLAKNNRPPAPEDFYTVSIFDKTIIYWALLALDDHTPIKSVTYDLQLISAGSTLISPLFDLNSKNRLTPSHGNQSTRNAIIARNISLDFGSYVQSVDNAFVGSKKTLLCNGRGLPICQETVVETKHLCKGATETIITPEPAYWFSFRKGYLGLQFQTVPSGLTFLVDEPDTLVSVIRQKGPECAKVHAYIIKVNQQQKKEITSKYICANQPIKLGIAAGWQTVSWTFGNETSAQDSIAFTTKKELTVSVNASSNNNGCKYQKDFNIKISDFELTVDNDQYILNQGESVQLGASGGSKYEWLPNVALSNNKVANPIASPIQTIQYEVTAFDSINCLKKARVKVEVINTGFLPNLFTPNGDGKNDDYKILGLYGASDFEFVIYNREGSVVYETTNWQTATGIGWNGQKSGVNQPSGLYYWKVQGKQPNGQTLLLNGKSTGSVLLIR